MSTLAALLPVLLAALVALRQIREDRRRGLSINWQKTGVTGVGVLLITGLAIAALLWRESRGGTLSAAILFGFVFLGGITALTIGVNRRWPRAGGW